MIDVAGGDRFICTNLLAKSFSKITKYRHKVGLPMLFFGVKP